MRRITLVVAIAIAMVAGVSACSNSDPEGTTDPASENNGSTSSSGTATVEKFGRFVASDVSSINLFDEVDSYSDATAIFFDLSGEVQVTAIRQEFLPETDTCSVFIEDSDTTSPLEMFGVTTTLISAGEVLTLSSPAGSLAELPQIQEAGFGPVYTPDIDLLFPMPAGLTIDIPGDQFPAFTAVSIPDVSPLTMVLPELDEEITTDTQFTWQAGNNSQDRIIIRTDLRTVGRRDTTEYSDLDFYCVVLDDGFFEFPDDIKVQLGIDYKNINELSIYRDASTLVIEDNVALLVQRSREDS